MRNVNYEEIKMILLNLKDISDVQLKRLVEVYGKDLVNKVIKDLTNEESNKDVDSNDDLKIEDNFNAYDYYIKDISNIDEISYSEKIRVIDEIVIIIKELNELFGNVFDNNEFNDKKNRPWIDDKVKYCLERCKDKEILLRISDLYNKYVRKRDLLVESNLRFVISIASEYYKNKGNLDFEDLIQYGNIGLIRAVESYDLNYETDFITYAGYWIRQSIIRNSKSMMYPCRIPIHLFDERNKMIKIYDNLVSELGRYPTDCELSNYMGISNLKFQSIRSAFSSSVSIDEETGIYIDSVELKRYELIPDDSINLEEDMFVNSMILELNDYMNRFLSDKENYILRNIYGFDGNKTELELGIEFGLSRQRIHQIKRKALEKLMLNPKVQGMISYLR